MAIPLPTADSVAIWTAIVGAVAALITAGSLVLALCAFRASRRQHRDALENFKREHLAAIEKFEKTLKVTYYAELDRMYFDLVAMRIGKPHLWGEATKPTSEQEAEYKHYRFLVWNYLETVFDRCIAPQDDRQEDDLQNTWIPAFKFESQLHGGVIGPEHADCFKETFKTHLEEAGKTEDRSSIV